MNIATEAAAQGVAAGVAATSGVGAWFSIGAEVAAAIFGVPLPVVLAAATGAFGAASFTRAGFLVTFGSGVTSTFVGSFASHGVVAVLEKMFGVPMSSGTLALAALGIAFFVTSFVSADFVASLRGAIFRIVDGVGRKP